MGAATGKAPNLYYYQARITHLAGESCHRGLNSQRVTNNIAQQVDVGTNRGLEVTSRVQWSSCLGSKPKRANPQRIPHHASQFL